MNIGAWMCGVLVIPFGMIGLLFGIFKGKAARFVAGFNAFSPEEQEKYDRVRISRDVRNQCLLWAGVMLIGTILSLVITTYMAIPTFIIWIVLFFKDMHIDPNKAYEKYLIQPEQLENRP